MNEEIEMMREELKKAHAGAFREQQDAFQVCNGLPLYAPKLGCYQERHRATPALQ
jgi:hypothetical protein